MRIGLKDIDPHFAQALTARLAEDCFPAEKYLHANIDWERTGKEGLRPPTPEEEQAYALHKRREEIHTYWGAGTTFLPLIPAGFVGFQQGILPGLVTWLVPTLFGAWQMKRTAARTALERELSPVELRAALPLLDLTEGEKLYGQALLHLLDAPPRLRDERGHEILRSMNELVERDRELERQLRQVAAAAEANSPQPLEEERRRIEERLKGVTDPLERASLEQTLSLCVARLDHAHAIQSAPRRLEAQREAVRQALASIPVALVRQTTAPGASDEQEVATVTETIAQIAQHARAEEAAVAEVLALRSE